MLLLAAAREELGELEGEVVGVGPVLAAARASMLLAIHRPDRVVLIGTAGAYAGGPAIGTVICARRVGLSPSVAALGLGYVPRPPAPVMCAEDLFARMSCAEHDVLTASAVTTDPGLAEQLAGGEWTVEHMEAMGVALACQQAGVPFNAVLGITNVVGPDAHTQWLTHRGEAQQAARDAVAPLLAGGLA